MRLMCIALLLSMLFVPGMARQTATPPAGTTQLMILIAGSDRGAGFLREARPTLDRLKGSVLSTRQIRNPAQNRDEAMIVLSFPTAQAANSFMLGLSGDGGSAPTEGQIPDGPNHSCYHDEYGQKMTCYFKFGNYRFVCINTNGNGACAQY